jgi:hypothetical protein
VAFPSSPQANQAVNPHRAPSPALISLFRLHGEGPRSGFTFSAWSPPRFVGVCLLSPIRSARVSVHSSVQDRSELYSPVRSPSIWGSSVLHRFWILLLCSALPAVDFTGLSMLNCLLAMAPCACVDFTSLRCKMHHLLLACRAPELVFFVSSSSGLWNCHRVDVVNCFLFVLCKSFQVKPGLILELPVQKLYDLWFSLLSHGDFPNTSVRCSVKCL